MPGKTTPVKEEKPPIEPESPKRDCGIHNGIRGNEYQIYVTMYILLRAYNDYSKYEQDFKLRMEPTDPIAGKFDDIWLEMANEHVFIQVKYNSDGRNLRESLLLSGKNDTFSLNKYIDSFEKCKKMKSARATTDEKRSYVLLTNKHLVAKEKTMFEEYSSETVLTPRIFPFGSFLTIAKAVESDEINNNLIIAAALPNLANLREEIEAEIKKTKEMEFKYGFHFLRDELFNWVCMKGNRNHKYIDRNWVHAMFDQFRTQQTKQWERNENDYLATIKESLQMFIVQDNQIGAIEETAIALNNRLKHMFASGSKETTQDYYEGNGISEHLKKNNKYQNIMGDSSAISQIFTLRQILHISQEYQEKDTHHLFISFRIKYETAKSAELLNLIKENGLPTKPFRACMESATLKQDDLRVLVNFAIKCVLKRAILNEQGSIFQTSRLVLCNGNELDIIGKTNEDVKNQYIALKSKAEQVGLIIDQSQTKYLFSGVKRKTASKWPNEDKIKTVNEVVFLGSLVTWDNDCNKAIEKCIEDRDSYKYHAEMLNSDTLDVNKKLSIYKNEILPKVLYGCEAWTVLKKSEDKLKKFEAKMRNLREQIVNVIICKQVRWAEQVARMADDEPARNAVIEASYPDRNNTQRNGYMRWFDAVDDHEKEKKNLRDAWARVIQELKPRNKTTDENNNDVESDFLISTHDCGIKPKERQKKSKACKH